MKDVLWFQFFNTERNSLAFLKKMKKNIKAAKLQDFRIVYEELDANEIATLKHEYEHLGHFTFADGERIPVSNNNFQTARVSFAKCKSLFSIRVYGPKNPSKNANA